MTTYSTGNPLGSSDPRDLYDNAENLDNFVNGAQPAYDDRLGRSRRSWQSVEDQADQQEVEFNADQTRRETEFQDDQTRREDEFDTAQAGRNAQFTQLMISGGYEPLGDYAAGIEVTTYKQVIKEGSEFWRAAAGTTLPYTTTGAGMPEGGAFVNIGDGLLRQDLVQPVATFNNVADMVASGGLDVGRKVRTLGYYSPGDGGGCDYEIVASGTGSNYGFLYEQLSGSGLEAKLLGGGIMEDKTAYIPTDYATLQEAIDDLSKLRPTQGATIDLMIESGHELSAGVVVSNGDYSAFSIKSVDNEVALSDSFPETHIIEARGAVAPALSCLINANGRGLSGYFCDGVSTGRVDPGCGVAFAKQNGLCSRFGSTVYAENAIFSNASQEGQYSGIEALGGTVSARGANVENSGYYGAQAASAGILDFRGGVANGAVRHGVRATNNGHVNARGASATGCGQSGFRSFDGSTMHAAWSDASGSGQGYFCQHGSFLNCRGGIANNCSIGIYARDGAVVDCSGATALNTTSNCIDAYDGAKVSGSLFSCSSVTVRAISAQGGAQIDIPGCEVENNGTGGLGSALTAQSGSRINASSGTIVSNNTYAVAATEGSSVIVTNASLTWSGSIAISLTSGSIVHASGAGLTDSDVTGGRNTISARGIVFG